MEVNPIISSSNRNSKSTSPNSFQYVYARNMPYTKHPRKFVGIKKSLTNTSEKSNMVHMKMMGNSYEKISKENTTSADMMKKQLDIIFQALPKIPKKPAMSPKNKEKGLDASNENFKSEEIHRIYQMSFSKRSKSSFSTKKSALPKIKKADAELTEIQKYMNNFYEKSKVLLGQLEERVLGKNNN
ncbi:hypothetical protein SteCoe_36313 [Stentor coeruleus]|uniref:Uncharacterized protein n=1 Tax=Stentor coeruleus TaxID=5963 RepID=A0A1R2AQD5_9CILI|nr:hypothetical protein SteCoe_36313 [Stentor coeruleus]